MKFDDETEVTVCSALGSTMGKFMWPKDDLDLIDEMDRRAKHCHLRYEGQHERRA